MFLLDQVRNEIQGMANNIGVRWPRNWVIKVVVLSELPEQKVRRIKEEDGNFVLADVDLVREERPVAMVFSDNDILRSPAAAIRELQIKQKGN